MTSRVTDVVLRNILERAAQGSDPLGVNAGPDPVDRPCRVIDLVEEAIDGADEVTARAMVADLDQLMGRATRTIGNPGRRPPLDRLMADLLLAQGLDPLTLTWLAFVEGSIGIKDENGRAVAMIDALVSPDQGSAFTTIHLPGRISWCADGTLYLPTLSQTMAAGLPGLPLRSVVSHPVLDRRDLTVVEAQGSDDAPNGWIRTDHRHVAVGVRDLTTHAPNGRR